MLLTHVGFLILLQRLSSVTLIATSRRSKVKGNYRYFDELTNDLKLSDVLKTYINTSVLLSICFSIALELIFYDFLTLKIKKEESKVSIRGISNLECFIRTYSQAILEFTESLQDMVGQAPPKKWTLRFNIRERESYLEETGQSNLDFVATVRDLLVEDLIQSNNFQVPLFSRQFTLFHAGIKKAYNKLLKDKHYDDELNDSLAPFMRNNYEVFTKNLEATLSNLSKKYLSSTRVMFDSELSKENELAYNISLKNNKTEPVLLFELFCELLKHILASCTDKKAFLALLEVLNEFMKEIGKNFKGIFGEEVVDTHYMNQFDRGYYEHEKNSSTFSNLAYPFLYLPIGNLTENVELSAHSVFNLIKE